jgi:PKD repeat protein
MAPHSIRMFLTAFLLVLAFSWPLTAQISEGGQPVSFSIPQLKGTSSLPRYTLTSFDHSALLQEDAVKPVPFRYAIFEDVSIDLRTAGVATKVSQPAGTLWRMNLECDSALSLQLIFKKFVIPSGASLFLYNPAMTQVLGAFTNENENADSGFVVSDVVGNSVVVEYFEPDKPSFAGRVIIGSVGKGYKDIFALTSGTSYVNINCSEGKESMTDKHAVCKMTFRSGSYSYLCSGALINNVLSDGKPYFLTASHCISDSAEAKSLVTYFNYENEGCSGTALTPKTLTGSNLVSTGSSSDYTLLLLSSKPPASFQPYYAGWNAENVITDTVRGIHHPEGLTKKISIDNDSIESNGYLIPWEGSPESPVGSHWEVNFDIGITAGGSSGSPLFNRNHQIIGQLHGGDDVYDLYGKFSYSFTHPTGKYASLKSILDPGNTGTKKLAGYTPAGIAPEAFFGLPFPKVCLEAPVILTDYSAFGPYDRMWKIYPSTYRFAEGSSQTAANPVVEFLEAGPYSISLTVSNEYGTDSIRFSNSVRAADIIDVTMTASPEDQSCLCTFTGIQTAAVGATSYLWEVEDDSKDLVYFESPSGKTGMIRPAPGMQQDSTVTVHIRVIGTHGTCSDTASLSYDLIRPENDNVSQAVTLLYGKSESFFNTCATVETGEPVPPHTSCTGQYSWCDEYGTGENIVEKSVWFRFIAGNAGHVSISSSGFDNEIALYRAESADSILAGNYSFIAANDDRTSTDYNPIIKAEPVVPGETYWIQVDGSAGGAEGSFTLQLVDLVVTSLEDIAEGSLMVYPQPAVDMVYVEGDVLQGKVSVSLFTVNGTLLYSQVYDAGEGKLAISTSDWEKGVYVARISAGEKLFTKRILKY